MEYIFVSGMSGAGKSTAARFLEDAGFCVTGNLPAGLVPQWIDLFRASGYDKVALIYDIRAGAEDFNEFLDVLADTRRTAPCMFLFLEADVSTIVRRYKETRRRHPMWRDGLMGPCIEGERILLAPLREAADVVLDTSGRSPGWLRDELDRILEGGRGMGITRMRPEDIRIHEAIKPPRYETLAAKRKQLVEGRPAIPTVTPDGTLVDGYAGYLALLEQGFDRICVFRCGGTARIAIGTHGTSSREYAWWVPPRMNLDGAAEILVDTRFGHRTARLVRIEECGWDEALRHRRVLGLAEGGDDDGSDG